MENLLQQSGTALFDGGGQSGLARAGRSDRCPAQRHRSSDHQT
jgi:hypothetical protein